MKRLISATASEVRAMSKKEKLESILSSEGRVIMAEITSLKNSSCEGITNGELCAAFGADMLLLNMFDVYHPNIPSLEVEDKNEAIHELKRLTGRMVGANLEPIDLTEKTMGEIHEIALGRQANADTAKKAVELGLDYILLTGNPGTGVSNTAIVRTLKEIKSVVKDEMILMAGKMHAAGSMKDAGENIITKELIKEFVDAGADIILIPAPATVPGISVDYVKELVNYAHSLGVMTISAIGTSQEGADEMTIRQIALWNKMCGFDIHHIGDAGFGGAVPESIYHYSVAIRGKRHTFNCMARSIAR